MANSAGMQPSGSVPLTRTRLLQGHTASATMNGQQMLRTNKYKVVVVDNIIATKTDENIWLIDKLPGFLNSNTCTDSLLAIEKLFTCKSSSVIKDSRSKVGTSK
ncbi:unnamed protein product [Dovyalis caffra]|uniref:Uncharacterized protein n=1 Tax=Dovyalis caffra TaxID=77055 RepID=A0AAV1RXN8_9ROSI|nr:unnamed protein product [Dovyalis caffra]